MENALCPVCGKDMIVSKILRPMENSIALIRPMICGNPNCKNKEVDNYLKIIVQKNLNEAYMKKKASFHTL